MKNDFNILFDDVEKMIIKKNHNESERKNEQISRNKLSQKYFSLISKIKYSRK
jgi:hypothetical protein